MAKKDFSVDAADIFNLREHQEEAKNTQGNENVQSSKKREVLAKKDNSNMKFEKKVNEDKLTSKTFRITERQHKALKMRYAQSNDPNEKDISAILRKALNAYLAEELEKI